MYDDKVVSPDGILKFESVQKSKNKIYYFVKNYVGSFRKEFQKQERKDIEAKLIN